jgi:hypothetical protein
MLTKNDIAGNKRRSIFQNIFCVSLKAARRRVVCVEQNGIISVELYANASNEFRKACVNV